MKEKIQAEIERIAPTDPSKYDNLVAMEDETSPGRFLVSDGRVTVSGSAAEILDALQPLPGASDNGETGWRLIWGALSDLPEHEGL